MNKDQQDDEQKAAPLLTRLPNLPDSVHSINSAVPGRCYLYAHVFLKKAKGRQRNEQLLRKKIKNWSKTAYHWR